MRIQLTAVTALLLAMNANGATVASPDGKIVVDVNVTAAGEPVYSVGFNGAQLITESRLGLTGKEAAITGGFIMSCGDVTAHDSSWTPVWGEYAEVRDNHGQLSDVDR